MIYNWIVKVGLVQQAHVLPTSNLSGSYHNTIALKPSGSTDINWQQLAIAELCELQYI